jgi:hypothetical protein
MLEIFKSATAYAQELKDLGAVRENYTFHDALMCIASVSTTFKNIPHAFLADVLVELTKGARR